MNDTFFNHEKKNEKLLKVLEFNHEGDRREWKIIVIPCDHGSQWINFDSSWFMTNHHSCSNDTIINEVGKKIRDRNQIDLNFLAKKKDLNFKTYKKWKLLKNVMNF